MTATDSVWRIRAYDVTIIGKRIRSCISESSRSQSYELEHMT